MNVFGDSIPAGVGASAGNGFVAQLVTAGVACTNRAVSGAMAGDQAPLAKTVTPGDALIYIGTNDAQWYGTDPVKREYFRKTLQSLIAWNLTPTKLTPTLTGAWVDDVNANPTGKMSYTVADVAAYSFSGTAFYAGMKFYPGAYGIADFFIDGATTPAISVPAPDPGYSTKNNAYPLDQDMLVRIGGLASGSHSVQIKNRLGTGTPNVIYLQWGASSDQAVKPKVYISKIQHWSAAAYASLPNSDANIDAYNAIIAGVVADFVTDGHNVVLVDPALTLSDLSADGIHPNDSGHTKIKNAFLAAINGTVVTPPPPANVPAYPFWNGSAYYISTDASFTQNVRPL